MTKKVKTIVWSIVGGAVALTLVGVYIFRPGKKKPASAPSLPRAPAGSAGPAYVAPKAVTALSDNINLRAGAAASTSSIGTERKGTFLGKLEGIFPDADGKKDTAGNLYQWAYVTPDSTLDVTDNFYVRTDLVTIT